MTENNYQETEQKKPYTKPSYKIEETMTFMFDAIKNQDTKYICRQCSSCHGCR